MTTENEREAHVYLAKVAEQAERYEGNSPFLSEVAVPFILCPGFNQRSLFPFVPGLSLRLAFLDLKRREGRPEIFWRFPAVLL
jgi:hypothetical protein